MWHEPFKIWDKRSADNAELTNDEIAEKARLTVAAPIENLRRKCIDATAATICRSISEFLDEPVFHEFRDTAVSIFVICDQHFFELRHLFFRNDQHSAAP